MRFLVFLCFVLTVRGNKTDEVNPCLWKETCEKCIQTDPRCAWCSQEDFTERNISRCDFIGVLLENNCTDLVNVSDTFKMELFPGHTYHGKYCQCSDFNCGYVNNKMCNGHGTCHCGVCKCDPGWSGVDCTCSNAIEKCLVDNDGDICSGHGSCYCGLCKCDDMYYGPFCEDCPFCQRKCEEYGTCVKRVLSLSNEKRELSEEYIKICETLTIVLVDKVEVNDAQKENVCSVEDEEGFLIYFKYEKENNESTIIYAERRKASWNRAGNPCISKQTCAECISANERCAWCSAEDPEIDAGSRCDYVSNLLRKCAVGDLVNPSSSLRIVEDSDFSGRYPETAVLLKPKEVNLRIRPGSSVSVRVEVKQPDCPVDLYILLDLLAPTNDYKRKLEELADVLTAEVFGISSDFRVGFGSFVGKINESTFVSPEQFYSDWKDTYMFRNEVPLTSETAEVLRSIRNVRVSNNMDALPSSFDAIMQATVCKREIGWRDRSWKILLFASSITSRYADDETVENHTTPNDGLCHMTNLGFYVAGTQGHPSISSLRNKIQENKINIIFAVTENQVSVYKNLSEALGGQTVVKLENISEVVESIREKYDECNYAVEMKDTAPHHVEVKYYSTCLRGATEQRTTICRGLKPGKIMTLTSTIEVTSCPRNRDEWNTTFLLYRVGYREAVTVNLETICECDCEKPWNKEENSQRCSLKGSLQCGICNCHDGAFGKKCECNTGASMDDDMMHCIMGNDRAICSGRGTCSCGHCECFRRSDPDEYIYGDFCECDNFSCDRSDGKICGGPEKGQCVCGLCMCKPGWTGSDCACSDNQHRCISPTNGLICSGHGICLCGSCMCYDTDYERFSGAYCEECPTCPNRCLEFKDCVECQVYPDGNEVSPEVCANCTFISISVEELKVDEERGERLCTFRNEKDCDFTFKYVLDEMDYVVIHAKREEPCPV